MLVSGDVFGRVVLVIQVPYAVVVAKHAIGVIHESARRRKVNLRPVLPAIVADYGCSGCNVRPDIDVAGRDVCARRCCGHGRRIDRPMRQAELDE